LHDGVAGEGQGGHGGGGEEDGDCEVHVGWRVKVQD
jgi:hypothetical protein